MIRNFIYPINCCVQLSSDYSVYIRLLFNCGTPRQNQDTVGKQTSLNITIIILISLFGFWFLVFDFLILLFIFKKN